MYESDPSVFSSKNGANLPYSDVTLISSDEITFAVHKTRLAESSEVFGRMLDVGSGSVLRVEEPASVLARLLPFTYPAMDFYFTLEFPQDLSFIRAARKYKISRGLEAITKSLK
ncbi:hypothetical protein RQP46_010730 [Phenoliferia psychrophenolica]